MADGLAALREVTGATVPDDKLKALLEEAKGDVNVAVQLFLERSSTPDMPDETMGVDDHEDADADMDTEETSPPPAPVSPSITALRELLDGAASEAEMVALLAESKGDVTAAVELYFNREPTPVAAPLPMGPPLEIVNGEFEVEIMDGKLEWTIGNVLGRVVVQEVLPGGAAHRAHIQKSDVLIECSNHPIKETNCQGIITRLSKETVTVPVVLRFRRSEHGDAPPEPKRTATKIVPGSSLFPKTASPDKAAPVVPYGLQVIESALQSMREMIPDQDEGSDRLLQYLLWSDGNVALAIDRYFQPQSALPDFAGVLGHDWFSADGSLVRVEPDWPMYDASFPTGPMGITVENIHERTVVVNVKEGTSAARANVSMDSWLLTINGDCVTHLTHKETLQLIQTLPRPLILSFCCPPGTWLPELKQQLARNVRVPQTHTIAGRNERIERHEIFVPEEDRVSFKRFERKLVQVLQYLPNAACVVLHKELSKAVDAEPTANVGAELVTEWASGAPPLTGAASPARQFLLQGFASLDSQPDKGEAIVLQTLGCLRQLALLCGDGADDGSSVGTAKWLLLQVLLNVFEAAAVIEKSTTWEMVVDALKAIATSLPATAFSRTVPALVARLSLYSSPSSRIVALALLPIVYARVAGDLTVQLRGMFDRLLQDEAPLVRRAGAHVLPELTLLLGPRAMPWTLQMLEKVAGDPSDLVRLYSVKAVAGIGAGLPRIVDAAALHLTRCQLLPLVNALVADSDWQVRMQMVASLGDLCSAFGPALADVLVDHFLALAKDVNMEVRVACAKSGFALATVLVETDPDEAAAFAKATTAVLPALFTLAKDPCVSVRRATAASVGDGVALFGEARGAALVALVAQLMQDKDVLARQSVVEALAAHCGALHADVTSILVSSLEALAKGPVWRTRLLAVESIGAWARAGSTTATMRQYIPGLCLALLEDPVCDVRLASAHALVGVARLCGTEWLATTGLAHVTRLLEAGTTQLQLSALHAVALLLGEALLPKEQADAVVARALAMTKAGAVNVRGKAWQVLAIAVATHPPAADAVRSAVVEALLLEQDVDVRKDILAVSTRVQ
ncbi:hypothetical protein ACHHYP_16557 [Achlya hypogyna]|uniref:PDZ domain-containing protein n=1 Tax=Achlya hypogyna TaxID=1202772 RepID=A0A1V9ZE14_ACHHY|nr:hypothetical protein ACHHYP_16557 [Achlya hypogyna]